MKEHISSNTLQQLRRDAARYRHWRDGDGIVVSDAPISSLSGEELDKFTDAGIERQHKRERAERVARFNRAAERARKVLKPGDRIRVTRCPGNKRWVTFAGWDINWIVTASGLSDIAPTTIDRVNDKTVDFTKEETP